MYGLLTCLVDMPFHMLFVNPVAYRVCRICACAIPCVSFPSPSSPLAEAASPAAPVSSALADDLFGRKLAYTPKTKAPRRQLRNRDTMHQASQSNNTMLKRRKTQLTTTCTSMYTALYIVIYIYCLI